MAATSEKDLVNYELISEAADLLNGLSFSASLGSGVTGDQVHVMVDPLWEDSAEAGRLLIMCFAPGERQVDWEDMPVLVSSANGEEASAFVARVNAAGVATIGNLPWGNYQLSVSPSWFFGDVPIVFPADEVMDEPEALAAAEVPVEPDGGWPELPGLFKTNDGSAMVTPLQSRPGELGLAFESDETGSDGAVVRFAVVYPSGRAECVDEVKLKSAPGKEGYHARWSGKLIAREPGYLMFQVFNGEAYSGKSG